MYQYKETFTSVMYNVCNLKKINIHNTIYVLECLEHYIYIEREKGYILTFYIIYRKILIN